MTFLQTAAIMQWFSALIPVYPEIQNQPRKNSILLLDVTISLVSKMNKICLTAMLSLKRSREFTIHSGWVRLMWLVRTASTVKSIFPRKLLLFSIPGPCTMIQHVTLTLRLSTYVLFEPSLEEPPLLTFEQSRTGTLTIP